MPAGRYHRCGAWQARICDATMVKPGAIVIDVGITRVPDATKKSGFALKGRRKLQRSCAAMQVYHSCSGRSRSNDDCRPDEKYVHGLCRKKWKLICHILQLSLPWGKIDFLSWNFFIPCRGKAFTRGRQPISSGLAAVMSVVSGVMSKRAGTPINIRSGR